MRINGLLCVDFCKSFLKRPRYECITGFDNSFFNFETFGSFGTELYVNTKELESLMKQEGYDDAATVAQLKILFNEFNLALSVILADTLLVKEKHEFQVSVGRITLKQNQNTVKCEYQIPASFIPLISHS